MIQPLSSVLQFSSRKFGQDCTYRKGNFPIFGTRKKSLPWQKAKTYVKTVKITIQFKFTFSISS